MSIAIFISTFCIMEFNAWALHKYVMHGFLWPLHKDHHQPKPNQRVQKNDFFAVFFAVPSFVFILLGRLYDYSNLAAIGYGMMAYGLVYFIVHEIIIHRRLKWFNPRGSVYLNALNAAHKIHHSEKGKNGASNFGMLVVSRKYFRETKNSS